MKSFDEKLGTPCVCAEILQATIFVICIVCWCLLRPTIAYFKIKSCMRFGDGGGKKIGQSFQNPPSQQLIKTVKPRVPGGERGGAGAGNQMTIHKQIEIYEMEFAPTDLSSLSLGVATVAG